MSGEAASSSGDSSRALFTGERAWQKLCSGDEEEALEGEERGEDEGDSFSLRFSLSALMRILLLATGNSNVDCIFPALLALFALVLLAGESTVGEAVSASLAAWPRVFLGDLGILNNCDLTSLSQIWDDGGDGLVGVVADVAASVREVFFFSFFLSKCLIFPPWPLSSLSRFVLDENQRRSCKTPTIAHKRHTE